jgi:UDP-N-acetyl-2-amino-2-deoxyglucuronate dehydrogenase
MTRKFRFGLTGAAGFVAPRHMRAIAVIGGELVAAVDPSDSVGIIDSYFPDARFFTEFERFDRYVDAIARRGEGLDYISICSPNYLHDAHSRHALRSGAQAICEKPLVLNLWNIDGLAHMEQHTNRRVYTILQLRLHESIIALKEKIATGPSRRHQVDLCYITSRGRWYHASWKGDEAKSGGVATNIGIHFFDMLMFVFGPARRSVAHLREPSRAGGFIECVNADVRWFLSIDANDLPPSTDPQQRTYRSVNVDGNEFEFSDGFADLHTRSYEEVVAGRGFGIDDIRPSIELVSGFRQAALEAGGSWIHPFTAKHLKAGA